MNNEPRLNLKLTMRYEREDPATPHLLQIEFQHGGAKLGKDSAPRLDAIVEYMTHKKTARIEIAGHTDNVARKRPTRSCRSSGPTPSATTSSPRGSRRTASRR